jgi:ribosome maturation factor RimP
MNSELPRFKVFLRVRLNKNPNQFGLEAPALQFGILYITFAPYSKVSGGDNKSPLSLFKPMTELRQAIGKLVEKHLPDETHFVVEVKMEEIAGKTKVLILIDADQGVTIQACARVSRKVSEELEENEILGDAYVLEVSSPGVDFPLNSMRQYQKNIGRELKVTLTSGVDILGKFLEMDDERLKLLVKKKEKGKKATEEEILVPFAEIKKSIVQVSFK